MNEREITEVINRTKVRCNVIDLRLDHPGPDTPIPTATEVGFAQDSSVLLASITALKEELADHKTINEHWQLRDRVRERELEALEAAAAEVVEHYKRIFNAQNLSDPEWTGPVARLAGVLGEPS